MTSERDNWDKPSYLEMARNPAVLEAWRTRTQQWEAEHPELSAAWDEALCLEDEWRRNAALRRAEMARLKGAGVPDRVRDAWLGPGLEPLQPVKDVRTYLDSGKTFMLMLGSAGVGKTVGASQALANGGLFTRAITLSRLSSYDKEDRRTWNATLAARVLVLDDLGGEALHDAWRPMLDELIDVRYGAKAPTVITSNLDKETFKTRYGERVVDRIRHDGFVCSYGGKSLRTPP